MVSAARFAPCSSRTLSMMLAPATLLNAVARWLPMSFCGECSSDRTCLASRAFYSAAVPATLHAVCDARWPPMILRGECNSACTLLASHAVFVLLVHLCSGYPSRCGAMGLLIMFGGECSSARPLLASHIFYSVLYRLPFTLWRDGFRCDIPW